MKKVLSAIVVIFGVACWAYVIFSTISTIVFFFDDIVDGLKTVFRKVVDKTKAVSNWITYKTKSLISFIIPDSASKREAELCLASVYQAFDEFDEKLKMAAEIDEETKQHIEVSCNNAFSGIQKKIDDLKEEYSHLYPSKIELEDEDNGSLNATT